MAAQLTFIPGVGFVKDPQTGNTSFIPGAGFYQEETAAAAPSGFQPAWARFSTLVVGPAGMGPTNHA